MTASFGTPPRARVTVLAVLLAALLGVCGPRLYVIQIIRQERLGTRAEGQYERRIPVAAKRGTIYDRRGRMLVITLDAASVFVHPGLVEDPRAGGARSFGRRVDARGRIVFREFKETHPGADLYLTIDEVIQHVAERELDAAVRRSGARAGTAIVMDPATGEILALANSLAYNPSAYARRAAAQPKNPRISRPAPRESAPLLSPEAGPRRSL